MTLLRKALPMPVLSELDRRTASRRARANSWHSWFAWYPAYLTHDRCGYIRGANVVKPGRTVWLRWIERSDHPSYNDCPAFRDPAEPTVMDKFGKEGMGEL